MWLFLHEILNCTLKAVTCSLKDIKLDNLLNLFTETLGEIYTIVLNFVQLWTVKDVQQLDYLLKLFIGEI